MTKIEKGRRVVCTPQDIIDCALNAPVKTPKQIGLTLAVRYHSGSVQLLALLNRIGPIYPTTRFKQLREVLLQNLQKCWLV